MSIKRFYISFLVLLYAVDCKALTVAPLEMVLISDTDLTTKGNKSLALNMLELIQEKSKTPFVISHMLATPTRAFKLIKRSPNHCMFNLIKTPEREDFLLFMHKPLSIFPPIRLITNADSSLKSPFEFSQLKPNAHLKIGALKDRSYGHFLDRALQNHRDLIYLSSQSNSSMSLLGMLGKSRLAGFLEYSSSIQELDTNIPFKALAIAGNSQPVKGYLACSKASTGTEIIDTINEGFKHPDIERQYRNLHQLSFGEQEVKLLEGSFNNIFDNER